MAEEQEWEYRIYLDDKASRYAIVDEVDYHWAIKWLWAAKTGTRKPSKYYAYRTMTKRIDGVKTTASLYLHVEIMKRTGIAAPTKKHVIVDHRNGKSLDCRRANLRWATRSMNSKNIHGRYPKDLVEG